MANVVCEEQDFDDLIGKSNNEQSMLGVPPDKNIPNSNDSSHRNAEFSTNPRKSSQIHYDRLSASVHNGSDFNRSQASGKLPTETSELDISSHYLKGKGWLASKKDVSVNPDIFAEGCKLLQAAAIGKDHYIQQVLDRDPEYIHFRDYDRRTILHVAASEGKLDIAKFLIEKYNARINRSDRWGGSPLDDAHRHRHDEVAEYLRSKGASTGSTDHGVNLITAAVTGDLEEMQLLLKEIPIGNNNETTLATDVNVRDYDGRTPAHLAAAAGHEHALRLLISKGADVNIVDSWGGTPLDDAVRMGKDQCILIIKENGGKVGKAKHLLDDSRSKYETSESRNLNVNFSEIDVIDKIGGGAFGVIYKCRWKGTLVACKCIKSSKIFEIWRENDINRTLRENLKEEPMTADELAMALEDFRSETSILKALRHPNICMLLGYSQTDDFQVVISELMRCSLLDVFTSHIINRTHLPKKTQLSYARQLARGMNYLHTCNPPIIHRDLKPANLLIDFSNTLKITDFGLAKVRGDPKADETQQFHMTGETGSYRYMAPEVFRHEEYNETVDIYSFAMILYYLLSGRPPWESLSGKDAAIKAARKAARPTLDRSWDNKISGLMRRCWDENPSARPSFSVVLDELTEYSKIAHNYDKDHRLIYGDKNRKCCAIS